MVAVVVLLPGGIHCNLHKLEILIQSPTSVLLQACSHVRLGGSSDCLDGQDGEYLLSWPWASSFCLHHFPFAVFALMSIFLINDCWTQAVLQKQTGMFRSWKSWWEVAHTTLRPMLEWNQSLYHLPSRIYQSENPHHVVFRPCHYSHLYVIRDRCSWVLSKLSSVLN